MGVGGQHHVLAALTLTKIWYPLNRRLGGPQNWSGIDAENLAPTVIQSLDCLACTSHYTEYPILAQECSYMGQRLSLTTQLPSCLPALCADKILN